MGFCVLFGEFGFIDSLDRDLLVVDYLGVVMVMTGNVVLYICVVDVGVDALL